MNPRKTAKNVEAFTDEEQAVRKEPDRATAKRPRLKELTAAEAAKIDALVEKAVR